MFTEQWAKTRFPADVSAIPAEFQPPSALHQRVTLINGELVPFEGDYQPVLSPVCMPDAEGQYRQVILGSYPIGTEAEAFLALDAAVNAYQDGRGAWPVMPVAQRITHVEDFTFRMLARKKEVVNLLMWEIGKSAADSEREFDRTVEYIYATIDALKELDNKSSRFIAAQGILGQVRRAPLGVVLCMGPFNYPLNETFTTLIPALIMGNTVLFKPPKYGTLLFHPLLEAFRDAFPPGVVNTVYGRGATVVPSLMETGKIDALALIGSSRVASELKKKHPKVNRLRAVLSLDAKNAAIVLPDADLDIAVQECLSGSLSFNGQRCTAIKIIFVHADIAAAFTAKFTEAVNLLKIGMPWEKGVNITPLPVQDKPAYLTGLIEDAVARGAQVLNQAAGGGQGFETLVAPAVVYPVNTSMRLYHEEQFGPVVPIVSFTDFEDPIQYQIQAPHGMQISIFGTDPDQIASLIDPLVNLVCRVNINCQCQRGPDIFPFTGRKDSAEGTLSVDTALRAFSIRTMVAAKLTEANKELLNKILHGNKSGFLNTHYIF
ncbi:MAG: NADP-dependent glyceraldehyde-3-phosphate dehydrogenase [Bacteroidia bacterium]|nr:NADP-dependent glyceraldehyde-3-phosphate dehydrogenase [Bacteroidia bacterium]